MKTNISALISDALQFKMNNNIVFALGGALLAIF